MLYCAAALEAAASLEAASEEAASLAASEEAATLEAASEEAAEEAAVEEAELPQAARLTARAQTTAILVNCFIVVYSFLKIKIGTGPQPGAPGTECYYTRFERFFKCIMPKKVWKSL